jgi:hypothetical protein
VCVSSKSTRSIARGSGGPTVVAGGGEAVSVTTVEGPAFVPVEIKTEEVGGVHVEKWLGCKSGGLGLTGILMCWGRETDWEG